METVQFPVKYLHPLTKSPNDDDDDSDHLSLETPIDRNLILEVERNGFLQPNAMKSTAITSPSKSKQMMFHGHQRHAPFSNEVAERASLIRQRFGQVMFARITFSQSQ